MNTVKCPEWGDMTSPTRPGALSYFVSYAHTRGFGRCEVTRDTPICSADDVAEIEQLILEMKKVTGVTVMNWRLFDEAPLGGL